MQVRIEHPTITLKTPISLDSNFLIANQRQSLGRARDHPAMHIVPNKALSLSLSLFLSLFRRRPGHVVRENHPDKQNP